MRDYDWAGWSKWNSLAKMHGSGFSMISEGAGAYAIATTKLKIPRVVGIDKHGLLYVGESSDMRSRIRAFYDSIERGPVAGREPVLRRDDPWPPVVADGGGGGDRPRIGGTRGGRAADVATADEMGRMISVIQSSPEA